MADEGREDDGDNKECGAGVLRSISDPVNNAFSIPVENGFVRDGYSAGSSCEILRTYKRRRYTKSSGSESKLLENLKVDAEPVDMHLNKTAGEETNKVLRNGFYEQDCRPTMEQVTQLGNCPLNRWKNTVLEQLYQSTCENEGGLKGCLQDALLFHPGSACGPAVKGATGHPYEDNTKCSSQTRYTTNGSTAAKPHEDVISDGTPSESSHTNTDLCQRAFFDIIMSEKFAQLCRLLLENFEGIKVDRFLDISLLNSRMKEGAYEKSPNLFHSDTQQLCTKLEKVGAEMVAIGKSLSETSKMTYSQQFRGVPDLQCNPTEKTAAASSLYKYCACRHCGAKEDGRDCLVCDSCEDMYHVSCIEPALEEIPNKSWYCANCTVAGVDLPHDDSCCAVCEKLKSSSSSSRLPLKNNNNNTAAAAAEDDELEGGGESESSKGGGLQKCSEGEGKKFEDCKVCGSEVDGGVNFRVCGHPMCPHKYYHVGCLTGKQLRTYGPRWYCPSCLCRGCLIDKDDDNIVLCDGCDHAYHIYCMRPMRTTVPQGKWFCRKCDAAIKRVRKAKRAYNNMQRKKLKTMGEGTSASTQEEQQDGDKSVDRMDMLLDAAHALNFEEEETS